MKRIRLLYLALLVLSIVWISFQGGRLPYLTFYTLLMIPIGSAAYLFYVCRALRFYQGPSSHLATRSEGFSFPIILENTGPLPIVSLKLIMEKELCSFLNFDDAQVRSLNPGSRLEFTPEIVCLFAGAYPVGAKQFVIRDCFGLFSYTGRIPSPWRAVVRPQITSRADALLDMEQIRSAMEIRSISLESTLGSELREYQKGDSLRHIHWKNSARSGTLLVRRPEPRQMEQIRVLLLPDNGDAEKLRSDGSHPGRFGGAAPPSHGTGDAAAEQNGSADPLYATRRRDQFLELIVSIADYFCRQNQSVVFWYPLETMQEMIVDSYENFQQFYERIPDLIAGSRADAFDWKTWLSAHAAGDGSSVLLLNEEYTGENQLMVWRM